MEQKIIDKGNAYEYYRKLKKGYLLYDEVIEELLNKEYSIAEFEKYCEGFLNLDLEMDRKGREDTYIRRIAMYILKQQSRYIMTTKDSPIGKNPFVNAHEIIYCTKGMNNEESIRIYEGISDLLPDLEIVEEPSGDQRKIARYLLGNRIEELIDIAKSIRGIVSYKYRIRRLFEEFPFLKYEQRLLLDKFEREGIRVDGRPDIICENYLKKVKYLTEQDRMAARKKTKQKSQKKKNLANVYSLSHTLNYANIGRYDYMDNLDDFGIADIVEKITLDD